jgi:hypothetical protein
VRAATTARPALKALATEAPDCEMESIDMDR